MKMYRLGEIGIETSGELFKRMKYLNWNMHRDFLRENDANLKQLKESPRNKILVVTHGMVMKAFSS